ncbi:unnamed protein product [Closterium sp. NIES-53]
MHVRCSTQLPQQPVRLMHHHHLPLSLPFPSSSTSSPSLPLPTLLPLLPFLLQPPRHQLAQRGRASCRRVIGRRHCRHGSHGLSAARLVVHHGAGHGLTGSSGGKAGEERRGALG